ncbi:protein with role in RNA processing [Sparganum proliferum]
MWKGVRPGAEISFVYDLNENVDGEFICLDETRRVVLLRKPSKSGRQNTYDIFMYRLDYIKDLKSSNANPITNYPDLDLDKMPGNYLSTFIRLYQLHLSGRSRTSKSSNKPSLNHLTLSVA